jgi:ATP-dependent Lon protease
LNHEKPDSEALANWYGQAFTLPERALIIVPMRNVVLFPGMILPLTIGREKSVIAAQHAVKMKLPIGLLLQHDPSVEKPGPNDLCQVGTLANVLRYITMPDESHVIVCEGLQRFRVTDFLPGYPFPVMIFDQILESTTLDNEVEARFIQLKERALELVNLLPQASDELENAVRSVSSPGSLADLIAGIMEMQLTERQAVLEAVDLVPRLDIVLGYVAKRLEVLKLSRKISERTKASLEQRQREFLLREQLKSIQKELGEDDSENSSELSDLRKVMAEAKMPEEVERQALKELKRLERMSDVSAEYSMIRAYLDCLTELPWKAPDPDRIDMKEARRILDDEHFGLNKVKKRIVEFLAVRKLNPDGHGPILCFVGPPGVGKTSLGQSIAKALGRKFVRTSLGGVHDEAEIRGHRRTYIGALPGNIIQAIRKAGSRGCVLMLDEIDKLGSGIQGDPSSALLEVLDPEQNNTFRDNYLALPFDLSRVFFITTANVLDNIPGPLRDRMEIIHLPGYTQEEKCEIARRYLVGRQMIQNGLKENQFAITDPALLAIIRDYTREAGVRTLERQIGAVCRRAAVSIAENSAQTLSIDEHDLAATLGPIQFENEVALRVGMPGLATGLAWTPVGGDILFIEAIRTKGDGKLTLTGQLGEVMKESAQAALTLLKARAGMLEIDTDLFEKSNVHVHVPAGAIPKDGPSAGVAMFISLASLFTRRNVRGDTAMTGEISLRGLVLPVGGIKEKVLAAMRAGITRVMLPARNFRDLEDVPAEAKAKLEFVLLNNVDEAMANAMEVPAAV